MFLRLGVTPGGCSGFSYAMGFDDNESDQDVYMDIEGLKVVVSKDDIRYLDGLEIDFEESGMTGGFTINNPNATATCGCGSSPGASVPGQAEGIYAASETCTASTTEANAEASGNTASQTGNVTTG
ncbi:hypothetical protein KC345_g9834 [Hortaea werneckii]|nr:hypothetical protein KC345_g9834 [Hortaea werneckii]